ncbi:MAG: penicillin-binding protein 1C, partial [Pseudomonadota bacterium]
MPSGRRGIQRACLVLAVGAALSVSIGVIAIQIALVRVAPLPLAMTTDVSPTVVDRNGKLLRAYTTAEGRWRLPVTADDVDARYLDLLLAFEDRRFDAHDGVDRLSVVRALFQAVRHRRLVSGASTLTMQVARLIAQRHDRTLRGKLTQMAWALDLERRMSKRAILNLYLRLAPFGGNIEGVRAASLSYFGREPARLSIAEAALLVALPQSPERRRPDRFAERALTARNHVIDVAVHRGIITAQDGARAKRQAVPNRRRMFPMIAPHVADEVRTAQPSTRHHPTTLDAALQMSLERLAKTAAQRTGDKLSIAILAADHSTGEIRARVGSPGLFAHTRHGAIDMSRAIRSPGSTLKPLVYGLGFDRGLIAPETLIDDRPTRFGTYAPQNFGGDFHGTVTVREALARSLNIPAVKVLDRIGPGHLVGRMARAGLTTHLPTGVRPSLAVALGGIGMDLHGLVALYAGLAREGQPVRLTLHRGDARGTAMTAAKQRAPARLLSRKAAVALRRILLTAPPPPNARAGEVAFKTGTSYGHRDAWAIGFDGRHVVGVWIGRADATAVPGLLGRTAAAPVLFDAFKRISPRR